MAHIKHTLREMALFAGAGGGILGGKLLGWECVCAVEWEPYPAAILAARQNEGFLPPFPIWDDVQTFNGKPWRGLVDVVSGGFPCQDISSAGRGAGITGERSGMWKHMARIIGEVRPRYVLVENSPVLTSRGLGVVLGDLAALGYDAEWGVLGANTTGGQHQRERIWIVAYSPGHVDGDNWGNGNSGGEDQQRRAEKVRREDWIDFLVGCDSTSPVEWRAEHSQPSPRPCYGGKFDGMAVAMDRYKAIGNGQDSAVVRLAWNTLIQRISR